MCTIKRSSRPRLPRTRSWQAASNSNGRSKPTAGETKPGMDVLAREPRVMAWTPSTALPDIAASGAEVAAVLVDHGGVAAFEADLAGHHAAALGGVAGRFEHAHVAQRVALFVEHAEHRVAVDDQPRQVGHRRRPGLLAAFA